MIDSQLRVSGVNEEWLLAAMGRLAREDFVPAAARGNAYIDRAVPLGDGHALPAPLVQGRMLGEAAPRAGDKVLVVSCGSDYLAALVGALGAKVTIAPAAQAAAGIRGVYDLIVVDGAIEHLPDALVGALVEGGRIVTGLVERGVTRLATGRKIAGSVALIPLADMGIPVLPEFAIPKTWSF
ncbi:MAG: protein-L-isoaspartate O-methyltransferase [Sphingomonadales bacterium]|nr:protein-L-isoaspartate O-methyltransferase [Sphingomonadales bacterium]